MTRRGALCLIRGCGAPRATGLPMCRKHWGLVPQEIRAAEWRALTNRDLVRRRAALREALAYVRRLARDGTDNHLR